MLASCLGDANVNKTQLTIGIIQLLTAVYLLGWFISIYWGWLIVKKSKGDHNEIKQLINAAGGTSEQQPAAGQQQRKSKPNNPYEDK